MGTDIHVVVQVRENSIWKSVAAPWIYRDYELFTRLCGVMGVSGITPLSEPRGYPDDFDIDEHNMHPFIRASQNNIDKFYQLERFKRMGGENPSYLTIAEINNNTNSDQMKILIREIVDLGINLNDVRLVFDFDS